jgi:protein-L-isoaspartate(D-aspartate) O-methyltransferase
MNSQDASSGSEQPLSQNSTSKVPLPDEREIIRMRVAMVNQMRNRGHIHYQSISNAMGMIPRHLFLPDVSPQRAYADEAVVTRWSEDGRPLSSASQPTMVAIMLEQLGVRPNMNVLEIGTGTGYNAALLASIVGPSGHVTTIDIDEPIVLAASEHLAQCGFEKDRVTVILGDGAKGYMAHAPYDRIIVTVGVWDIPPIWFEQLRNAGKMVVPLSIQTSQFSLELIRHDDCMVVNSFHPCGFIRLRGDFAGPEEIILLPDVQGARIIAESLTPSTEKIQALLATQPRTISLSSSDGEILRFLLPLAGQYIVTFTTSHAHPKLGSGAIGWLVPDGDSACWLVYTMHTGSMISRLLEYGASTAGLQVEHLLSQWHASGSLSFNAWNVRLIPKGTSLPPVEQVPRFIQSKYHWQIVSELGCAK